MPLKDIGPLKLQGRFLNGTATFKIALHGGTLDVRVENVAVQSKPLPPLLLAELKKQNLAREFQNNPQTAANIARFESIVVTNRQVILRNRPK